MNSSEQSTSNLAFQWSPAYSVGVDEIDAEHRSLFRLAGRLQKAMLAGAGKGLVEELLAGLIAYTCQHFAHEEDLMRTLGYPGLAAHCRQHEALRARVAVLRQRSAAGEITMTIEILHFLSDWLRVHIADSDRLIGQYQRQLTRCGTALRTPPPR